MDDRWFDIVVRSMASATNRRQLLRGLLGIVGLSSAAPLAGADAAVRRTPTPKPVTCPGQQAWNGTTCVCPSGKSKCGPACCTPGVSVCCDNACCTGTCYGEELCCPTGSIICDGQCRNWQCCTSRDCPSGSVCNPETHTCQRLPSCAGKTCGSDGCGGSCGSCPEGQTCDSRVCRCTTGFLCTDGACHACCSNADCPSGSLCDAATHTCGCAPDCTGKTCGSDGCGGQRGTCPDGQTCESGSCQCSTGHLCANGTCNEC